MKKIINRPDAAVRQCLEGMALAHPDLLRVQHDPDFVIRADAPQPGQVAVVSGGGAGHEPLHCGFVGPGMLTAAVPGPVFTSPTPDQIAAATTSAHGGAGVLQIVKNYTGDVLNFETAAELSLAEGIEVSSVLVADDVAVEDSTFTAGRRGVAGTLVVEKLAGACAAAGADLSAVTQTARTASERVRSMGLALGPCVVPHSGRPSFELSEQEMELGIGIHGEPGRARMAVPNADEMVRLLLEPIVRELPGDPGDPAVLVVNGMGGTPLMELYLAARSAQRWLSAHGVEVARYLVGSYVTSLEMPGFSLTLARLDSTLLRLWDAPVHTAALRW